MRVPNAGQELDERRIVREGRLVAEAMLANYVEPPSLTLPGLVQWAGAWSHQMRDALRKVSIKY